MSAAYPSRFRHPLVDPDPLVSRQYLRLYPAGLAAPLEGQIELLRSALSRGDPLADDWLACSQALGAATSDRLFESALSCGIDRVEDAPAALSALFRQLETVPLWLDTERLRNGAQVCRRVGLIGTIVLSDFALLGGYRSAAVAKTLIGTGKLRDDVAKRLTSTRRFVTTVTEPGDMLRGRAGYEAAVRVRMVHAHVRAGLLGRPSWRSDVWGLPINQADMLSTNLLFSIGYVDASRKWGFRFSGSEVEDVLHLWRYIGYVLGIEDVLLPGHAASARTALYAVGVSQPSPDADSATLAQALQKLPLSFAKKGIAKPFAQFEMELRMAMTRNIFGDQAIEQLGLPRSRLGLLLPPLVAGIGLLEIARQTIPFGSYAAYKMGSFALHAMDRMLAAAVEQQRARLDRAKPPARPDLTVARPA
ncbi:MAG: hypothetical protein JWN04_5714 [Myxococcaceae bacterium]|nr:hypothetical protein [Myxococcaceae bacterium]